MGNNHMRFDRVNRRTNFPQPMSLEVDQSAQILGIFVLLVSANGHQLTNPGFGILSPPKRNGSPEIVIEQDMAVAHISP